MRAAAPPPATSETGRMRALAPPIKPIAPMPLEAPKAESSLPSWTPEPLGMSDDEFAQISAQAKLGVQQRTVDDAARRKKMRLAVAAGVAIVVAGGIVFLIEKFYDPEARAREAAIAATVQQMAEQQKATDNLTLIEIDIENAIMNNDLDTARRELAKLVDLKPDHPRREFLQNAIDRSAAIARLTPQTDSPPATPQQAAVVQSSSASRSAAQRVRTPERTPERVVARAPERTTPSRSQRDEAPQAPSSQRSYGAPIGEAPRQASIPLDAPINTPPTTAPARRADNSFVGRTLEASDSATMSRAPAPQAQTQPQAAPTSSVGNAASPSSAGSAAGPMPAAAPAPAPTEAGATAAVDVVPAKIVRRVTPVAPFNIPKKTSGYVVLMFSINEKGRVSDVSVVESTPPGVFDDAAMTAVRKWVYEPRKENGVAVPSQSKARLVFAAAE
jgi:protein TonB